MIKLDAVDRSRLLLEIVGIIALFLVPPAIYETPYRLYILHILILAMIYAVFGQSWNILAGYAGQVSLGHEVLLGTGAYASALLIFFYHANPWLTLIASAVMAIAVGMALGAVTFKLRGFYFALATLAFAEMVRLIVLALPGVTRGAEGVPVPVPRPVKMFGLIVDFKSKFSWYYITLVFMIIVFYLTYKLTRSKYGLLLRSIREDEDAAASLGADTFKLKMLAMIVSAAFAGIAGGLYANYMGYIDPAWEAGGVLSPFTGLDALVIGILGGMGTVIGPLIGSLVRVGLGEYLRAYIGIAAGFDIFTFGIIIVAVVLALPAGIWGYINEKLLRREAR